MIELNNFSVQNQSNPIQKHPKIQLSFSNIMIVLLILSGMIANLEPYSTMENKHSVNRVWPGI